MKAPSRRTTSRLEMGCFLLLLIALGAYTLFFTTPNVPTVFKQFPTTATPLIVSLTAPVNDTTVPTNNITSVQAEAFATKPITALELWVDDALVETKQPPVRDLNKLRALWVWKPASEGEHVLLVRAIDEDHHSGMPSIVRVRASKDANSSLPATYQIKSGDSLATVAQTLDTTPQQILDQNPQLRSDRPLVPGSKISVRIPIKPADAMNATPPGPSRDATLPTSRRSSAIPESPQLMITVDGCDVQLSLSDLSTTATRFLVYRLDPRGTAFKRIATLAPPEDKAAPLWADLALSGTVEYFVSSFNTAGETPSNIASVSTTNPNCPMEPPSAVQITNGKLTSSEPVDKAYCYYSINGDPWTRVPPAPQTFVLPTNGVFDVRGYIKSLSPAQTTTTVALQCWGWEGGKLGYLGAGKETFGSAPTGPLAILVSGERFKLVGDLLKPVIGLGPTPLPFIFPPQALTNTASPETCANHVQIPLFGGALCGAAIQQHWLALVWDWLSPDVVEDLGNPQQQYQVIKDLDGYRVYENDRYYAHQLVATTTAGPGGTGALLPLPPKIPAGLQAGPFGFTQPVSGPQCLVVRAYKGNIESTDSNAFCAPSEVPGTQWATLAPSRLRHVYRYHHGETGFAPVCPEGVISTAIWPQSELWVGYYHYHDVSGINSCSDQYAWEGLAQFDLSGIGPILSATLRYHLDGSDFQCDSTDCLNVEFTGLRDYPCTWKLMLPTQDWSNAQDLVAADDYLDIAPPPFYAQSSRRGPDFAWDVTGIVQQWWQQGFNYGFEVRGWNEDTGAEDNNKCDSGLSSVLLDVNYFAP